METLYLIDWNGVVEYDKKEGGTPAKKAKQKNSLLVRLEAGEQKKLERFLKNFGRLIRNFEFIP